MASRKIPAYCARAGVRALSGRALSFGYLVTLGSAKKSDPPSGRKLLIVGLSFSESTAANARASAWARVTFFEGPKKVTKERPFPDEAPAGSRSSARIFRLTILARSENDRHPCRSPFGSGDMARSCGSGISSSSSNSASNAAAATSLQPQLAAASASGSTAQHDARRTRARSADPIKHPTMPDQPRPARADIAQADIARLAGEAQQHARTDAQASARPRTARRRSPAAGRTTRSAPGGSGC